MAYPQPQPCLIAKTTAGGSMSGRLRRETGQFRAGRPLPSGSGLDTPFSLKRLLKPRNDP